MAEQDRRSYKFDWRMFIGMFVVVVGQGAIQYGVIKTNQEELARRMEHVEQKIDDKMEPRDEYEKRHEDLRREVEDLRERVQQLEIKAIGNRR
jgi:dsDNA-specific endonuclease/ATPase MutS2